jgi:hypothetical protein
MSDSDARPGTGPSLARVEPRLLGTAAVGGLLGGVALFLLMASYNASAGTGFWTILNVCFAAWVFRSTGMAAMPARHMARSPMMGHHSAMASPMPSESAMASHTPMPSHSAMAGHAAMGHHAMGAAMMGGPLLASHVIVGSLLHLAMSAAAGVAFAVALAVLIRSGLAILSTPAGYVIAAAGGGALLYAIMMYGFAPLWNKEIVDFTPRVPFFLSHLLFGAIVGGWVYLRLRYRHGGATATRAAPAQAG